MTLLLSERTLKFETHNSHVSECEIYWQCKTVGLSLPESQWLYLISDSDSLNNNVSAFASLLSEGENIAFAHDSSSRKEGCEVRDLPFSYLTVAVQTLFYGLLQIWTIFSLISRKINY
jgi:hypothetical protein